MQNACMVALQIRDVPDDVRNRLAERAAIRGQSLQAYLLDVVSQEASRSANLALLEQFAHRHDGSRLTTREASEEVERARSERDTRR